jgi:hypothetical protein
MGLPQLPQCIIAVSTCLFLHDTLQQLCFFSLLNREGLDGRPYHPPEDSPYHSPVSSRIGFIHRTIGKQGWLQEFQKNFSILVTYSIIDFFPKKASGAAGGFTQILCCYAMLISLVYLKLRKRGIT